MIQTNHILKRLALALCIPILFFVLLELGLALFGFHYTPRQKVMQNPTVLMTKGTQALYLQTIPEPDRFMFRTIPDTEVTGPNGFRLPEPPMEKNTNRIRVAFLGGSTTQGGFTPYPQRAIDILNQALGSNRYEMLNAACSSYSSHQTRHLFDDTILDFQPDIVMIYHGWNDASFAEDGYSDAEKDLFARLPSSRKRHRLPLMRLRTVQFLGRILDACDIRWPRIRVSPERFEDNLAHIIEQCGKQDIDVILMVRPVSQDYTQDYPNREQVLKKWNVTDNDELYYLLHQRYTDIQRSLAEQYDHVRLCDGLEALNTLQDQQKQGTLPEGSRIFSTDACHVSTLGEQQLAEYVAQAIATQHGDAIQRHIATPAYHLELASNAVEELDIPAAEYHLQQAQRANANLDTTSIETCIETNRRFYELWTACKDHDPNVPQTEKLALISQCIDIRPHDIGLCHKIVSLCDKYNDFEGAAELMDRIKPNSLTDLAAWTALRLDLACEREDWVDAYLYAQSLASIAPANPRTGPLLNDMAQWPDFSLIIQQALERVPIYSMYNLLNLGVLEGFSDTNTTKQITHLLRELQKVPADHEKRNQLFRLCLQLKDVDILDTLCGLKPPPQKPITALNDGDLLSVRQSDPTMQDTVFFIEHEKPCQAFRMFIVVYNPGDGMRLKDIAVVAHRDRPTQSRNWVRVPARLRGTGPFSYHIRLPNAPDGTTLTLEIDPAFLATGQQFTTWGIACLSNSDRHERNYTRFDPIIAVRELLLSDTSARE